MSIKTFSIIALTGLAVATAAEAGYAALSTPADGRTLASTGAPSPHHKVADRLLIDPASYQQKHHGRGRRPSRVTHCVNTSVRVWDAAHSTWHIQHGTTCYGSTDY